MTTSKADGVSGIRLFASLPAWRGLTSSPRASTSCGNAHRYAVVAPSIHPMGHPYRWLHTDGTDAKTPDAAALPELPAAWVEGLSLGPETARTSDLDADVDTFRASLITGEPSESVRDLLRAFEADLNSADRHGVMLRTADALAVTGAGGARGVPEALAMRRSVYRRERPRG